MTVRVVTVTGPCTKTTFLASEVIGVASGPNWVAVYLRGGGKMRFDGLNSDEEPASLMESICNSMTQAAAGEPTE